MVEELMVEPRDYGDDGRKLYDSATARHPNHSTASIVTPPACCSTFNSCF
jgi:hypothetical protein